MLYIRPSSTIDAIICWKYDGAILGSNGSRVNWYIPINVINAVNTCAASVIGAWWYPAVRSITPNVFGRWAPSLYITFVLYLGSANLQIRLPHWGSCNLCRIGVNRLVLLQVLLGSNMRHLMVLSFLWSERGWKKSRIGKKGSLRVTTGEAVYGINNWKVALKGSRCQDWHLKLPYINKHVCTVRGSGVRRPRNHYIIMFFFQDKVLSNFQHRPYLFYTRNDFVFSCYLSSSQCRPIQKASNPMRRELQFLYLFICLLRLIWLHFPCCLLDCLVEISDIEYYLCLHGSLVIVLM